MRSVRKAVVTVLAAGMLAACGGDGEDGRAGSGSSPRAEQSPKPTIKAPEEFNASKGWQQTVKWPKDGLTTVPVGAASEVGVVAFLQEKGENYVVEARDAVTGALRWSSQPWQPPAPGKNVAPDASQLPQLVVVNEDGREYVAVSAYVPTFSDEDTLSLLLYPADSTGKGISPAHTFSIPLGDAYDKPAVVDGGDGILVRWEDGGRRGLWRAAAIELPKGRITTYDEMKLSCGEDRLCSGGSVEALSPDGPVVQLGNFGGFGVPDVWHVGDAIPPGSKIHVNDYHNGRIMRVLGKHVLSTWFPESGPSYQSVMAMHDLKSGKLVASASCKSDTEDSNPAALSPDGRYAVSDTIALDLEQGKAYCFDEDNAEEAVYMVSVADGTAYGYIRPADENVPVTVKLDTGKVEALPRGTEVPSLLLSNAGGFSSELPNDDGEWKFVFLPRR
jgi:hypothetical protein